MLDNFQGAAKRLDDIDLPMIGHRIGVGEDEVHALMDVEARNSGFDRQDRPAMLFEPHLFYRNLSGAERERAVSEGLAYKDWRRDYPTDSYPRLIRAMAINPEAALKSCSWGLGQILGSNHLAAGYPSAEAMVRAFLDDEQEHLEAMIRFILDAGIADDLRAHRWSTVARVYNGPSYAVHGYHTRLEAAYRKWAGISDTAWEPDREASIPVDGEELKAVQRRLHELGYTEVGTADGKWGTKTRAGVLAFRADHGLPIYVGIDDELLSALMLAPERVIAEARATATTADLRASGSRQIAAADKTEGVGWLVAGGGGLTAVTGVLNDAKGQLGQLGETLGGAGPIVDALKSASPYLLLGLGAYVIYQQWVAKKVRVEDHREAKNVGR